MSVDIERNAWGRVAHVLLNLLHIRAQRDQERSALVPKLVDSHSRHCRSAAQLFQILPQVAGVGYLACLGSYYVAVGADRLQEP